jgi:inner membrane protein YidH
MADGPDLARMRTDFAEDRTVLANERTFASWTRTGFAAIGIGLGFHALFGRIEPLWLPRAVATAFLAIAILIFIAAERRACIVIRRLHTHEVETVKIGVVRLITIVTVAATLALIAAIWLLTR